MQQHLRHLHEIQKIDLGIKELEQSCEGAPQRLQEIEKSVQHSREEVSKLSQERDAFVRESKDLEGSVQAETHKIRKWGQRLNEIRNQREYLALSREVEGSKRANREAEERILELMSNKDSVEGKLEVVQDRLAEEEIDCEQERDRVEQALNALREKVETEKMRRDALVPQIPASLYRKYEAIRSKRLGVGLVAVVEGSCTGCNMKLPPQLYNILQRGDSIEQCPSCSRLIVWERLLEQADDSAASGAEASP